MPLTRDEDIAELLTNARTIAMVGASDRPDRPSYGVMRIPPGPRLSRASGQPADHRRACPRRVRLARAGADRRADRHRRHLPPPRSRGRGGRPGDLRRRQGGVDAARRDQRGSRGAGRSRRAQGRDGPLPGDRDHRGFGGAAAIAARRSRSLRAARRPSSPAPGSSARRCRGGTRGRWPARASRTCRSGWRRW